ncbi:MAG TPA: hypothetical protein VN704_09210 [Verrucomicrobiae bacterium]|nr:hypothetical protein [Verrucomicrobiae bacterium]
MTFDILYRERFLRRIIAPAEEMDEESTFICRRMDNNKNHTKKKIVMGYTVCRIKKFMTFADVFSNKFRMYNKVSDIVTDLINYRLKNY